MHRFPNARIAVVLVLILALGAALAVPAHAIMVVSRSQEVSIGKEVEADVISQYGGLSRDAALNARVARVGNSIAAVSPRRDVTYKYEVVNSDVINAFAAPGGPVIITKQLAQMLPTDDELAFVLAHETGHIAAQHGRKAINQAVLAQGIASLLFGSASQATQLGLSVMYTLYTSGYSRSQEYQADTLGVQLMQKAGYNPEGAIMALAKLGTNRTRGINKYLATHPDVPDRIDRVAKLAGISQQREQYLVQQAQTEVGAR